MLRASELTLALSLRSLEEDLVRLHNINLPQRLMLYLQIQKNL
jgi:hypothetical protein